MSIQYRRGVEECRSYGGRSRNNDAATGLAIAGAVIGGAIIAEEVSGNSGSGSGYRRCSRAFRSFNSDTGTDTTDDGEPVAAPICEQ